MRSAFRSLLAQGRVLALAATVTLSACDSADPAGPDAGDGARLVLSDTSGVAWSYKRWPSGDYFVTEYTSALFDVQVIASNGATLPPSSISLRSGRHGCTLTQAGSSVSGYGGPGTLIAVRGCRAAPSESFVEPVLEVRSGGVTRTQRLRIATETQGLGVHLPLDPIDVTVTQGHDVLLLWRDPKLLSTLTRTDPPRYTLVEAEGLRVEANAAGLPVLRADVGARVGPRGDLLLHVTCSDGTPLGAYIVNVLVASGEVRPGVLSYWQSLVADNPGGRVTLLRDDGQAFYCIADGDCRPVAPSGTVDGTPIATAGAQGTYVTAEGRIGAYNRDLTIADRINARNPRVAVYTSPLILAPDGTAWKNNIIYTGADTRLARRFAYPLLSDIAALVDTDSISRQDIPSTYLVGFDRRIVGWYGHTSTYSDVGALPEVPTAIVGAHHAAAVLLPSGAVWAWGDAAAGWLADPAMISGWRGPARVAGLPDNVVRLHRHDGPDGTSRVVVHTSTGEAWMWGRGVPGCGTPGVCYTPTRVPEFDGAVAVYAGRALLADGSVKPVTLPSKRLFAWPSSWRLRVSP